MQCFGTKDVEKQKGLNSRPGLIGLKGRIPGSLKVMVLKKREYRTSCELCGVTDEPGIITGRMKEEADFSYIER